MEPVTLPNAAKIHKVSAPRHRVYQGALLHTLGRTLLSTVGYHYQEQHLVIALSLGLASLSNLEFLEAKATAGPGENGE